MNIEHSMLMNEFISFWFETRVEGALRYETYLNFHCYEWYTCKPGEDSVLLRGKWDAKLSDDRIIDYVAPFVTSAIESGRI
jgi:hypothetical protein